MNMDDGLDYEEEQSLIMKYFGFSSLHGLQYLASETYLVIRLFWMLSCMIGVGLAIFIVTPAFEAFLE